MSKSIQINQKMRENVVRQLAVSAVAKSAAELNKTLRAINADFWEAHTNRLEKKTGMSRNQFAPLIADRIFATTIDIRPQVKVEYQQDEGPKTRWAPPLQLNMNHSEWDPIKAVLMDPSVDLIGRNAFVSRRDYGGSPWVIRLEHAKPVPMCKDMQNITSKAMLGRIEAVAEQANSVIRSVLSFYYETLSILEGCRTSRQLADVFPEAAKLLPAPVKKTGHMIPQEKADQVRALLQSGIPA